MKKQQKNTSTFKTSIKIIDQIALIRNEKTGKLENIEDVKMKNYQVNKIVKNSTILVKEVDTLTEAHEVYANLKGKKEIKNMQTGNIVEANY